ncbi:dTDP-4-amino-4,6-dideoxygalactose transaminase [Wukongibacter baidiensis]|uniref:dTDP-4-amino-4,6-dideoxygalactose transaminase n=1 Tax=Wukongibacter baidiensis TaxID=1723361 RepID=UPI003D7FF3D2
MSLLIHFNTTYKSKNEEEYILDVLGRKKTCGDGYYTKKVSNFIENKFNTKEALMTTSCSSALDMASILLDLKEGDEIIMPSYTFVSTANSVVLRGARPIFIDIDSDTLNVDVNKLEEKITKNTKAIYPVHYAGVSCDMDKLLNIAKRYNLKVVEDAAQGVNAKYKDKYLGTIGDLGCYSFHETKNYSCGEGGCLLLNKDNELIERAEIVREKGTNRKQFFKGEVDKYTWVDKGSSYLPSEILMAMLLSQFEEMNFINEKRKKIYNSYYEGLRDLEAKEKLRLPIIPAYSKPNYHMFYIVLNSGEERNKLILELKERGIQAVFHYIPLHSSPMGKKLGYREGDLKATEDLSTRLLRLPLHLYISQKDIERIIDSIYCILTQRR